MKKLILGAAALLMVAACGKANDDKAAELPTAVTSGIDLQYMDTSVKSRRRLLRLCKRYLVAEYRNPG